MGVLTDLGNQVVAVGKTVGEATYQQPNYGQGNRDSAEAWIKADGRAYINAGERLHQFHNSWGTPEIQINADLHDNGVYIFPWYADPLTEKIAGAGVSGGDNYFLPRELWYVSFKIRSWAGRWQGVTTDPGTGVITLYKDNSLAVVARTALQLPPSHPGDTSVVFPMTNGDFCSLAHPAPPGGGHAQGEIGSAANFLTFNFGRDAASSVVFHVTPFTLGDSFLDDDDQDPIAEFSGGADFSLEIRQIPFPYVPGQDYYDKATALDFFERFRHGDSSAQTREDYEEFQFTQYL